MKSQSKFNRKIFTWRGKQYDGNNTMVVIDNKQYNVCCVTQYSDFISIDLDENGCYVEPIGCTQEEIDKIIEDVIEFVPQNKQEERVCDKVGSMSLESGIIWYIIIMVGGAIFKDAYLIWVFATIYFVAWFIKKPKFKK